MVHITDDSTHCLSYHWRGWGRHRAGGRPPPPSPLGTRLLNTPPVGWGQSDVTISAKISFNYVSASLAYICVRRLQFSERVFGSKRCYSLWFVCQWTLRPHPPSRSHFPLWISRSHLQTCHCAQWAPFLKIKTKEQLPAVVLISQY